MQKWADARCSLESFISMVRFSHLISFHFKLKLSRNRMPNQILGYFVAFRRNGISREGIIRKKKQSIVELTFLQYYQPCSRRCWNFSNRISSLWSPSRCPAPVTFAVSRLPSSSPRPLHFSLTQFRFSSNWSCGAQF